MKRLLTVALTGLALGAGTNLALMDQSRGCGLLDQGTARGDGVFLAVGCEGARSCTVGDATKPIAREMVPDGVRQDCVAFNQYVGAGLNAIPGYLTGECFAFAEVDGTRFHPEHRCDPR